MTPRPIYHPQTRNAMRLTDGKPLSFGGLVAQRCTAFPTIGLSFGGDLRRSRLCRLVAAAWFVLLPGAAAAAESEAQTPAPESPLIYIDTSFENASPVDWSFGESGEVFVNLMYDHQRSSPNRAAGHIFFAVEAPAGSTVRLVLQRFDNVWNGKPGSPVSERTVLRVSEDGKRWSAVGTQYDKTANRLMVDLSMTAGRLFVARLEPYRLSDLDELKRRIAERPVVKIETIGRTVEGRELEMISIGRADAPHHVLIRARAHPWETGGNWVIEGLIDRLLADAAEHPNRQSRYQVHIMPLANKDGVARGRTRFNSRGYDLNRQWGAPADPALAPENAALEAWLQRMIAAGKRPGLAIDLHNDEQGKLHLSRPDEGAEAYLGLMNRFESLLRKHTWFSEGSTGATFRNPGSFGEGLWSRYQIPACVLELNANHVSVEAQSGRRAGPTADKPVSEDTNRPASRTDSSKNNRLERTADAELWRQMGAGLVDVFFDFFADTGENRDSR